MADPTGDLWTAAVRTRERTTIAVLADALLERGDPRGRFMQLLLTGGREAHRRAATLLETHRQDWLGELSELVVPGSDVWRHGLLVGFRPHRDGAWPAPDHPAWQTIEQLDLRWSPLQQVFPVFDALDIPIRALHNVGAWNDLATLLRRPSPRPTLQVVATDHHAGVATASDPAPLPGPVRLAVDTLRLPIGLGGPLRWSSFGGCPPRRVEFPVGQRHHRILPHQLDRAVEARAALGCDTRVWHTRDGVVVFTVDLGAQRSATLHVDGELPVGWRVLSRLTNADVPLRVVGALDGPTADRLDRRCPGWMRADATAPAQVNPDAEFRATLSSWQVTEPLCTVRFYERSEGDRVWLGLYDDMDGLIDSVASGVTGHEDHSWPPR